MGAVFTGCRRSVEAIGKMHYRREEDPLGYNRQHEPMHIMDGVGMVWGAIRDPFPKLDRPFRLIKETGVGVSKRRMDSSRTTKNVVLRLLVISVCSV